MLPHDDDARRLAGNAYHFGEFFTAFDVEPPRLKGKALLWGHCHHRATGGVGTEQQVLERMGLEVESLSGGCCGLAGSWGFETGKYDISMDCGEQALLPAVRDADPETLVVANGFSCQTQIADAGTGRRALHLGQVMATALREGASAHRDGPPEEDASSRPGPTRGRRVARVALPLGLAAVAATAVSTAASTGVRHLTRGVA